MNKIALSSLKQLKVRHAIRSDLNRMEWGGELTHFRKIFHDAYFHMQTGVGLVWIAEYPVHGLIGQLMISLRSSRSDLSDGRMRAYLYGFRVRPEYRSQGVGSVMMQTVEEDLTQRGYGLISLNVAQENLGAWKLYENLGYKVVGSDEGEWSYIDHLGNRIDVHEPAWRMEKKLY